MIKTKIKLNKNKTMDSTIKSLIENESLIDALVNGEFMKYDVDNSGYIDKSEFINIIKPSMAKLNVELSDETLANYMKKFDTDKDDKISKNEYKKYFIGLLTGEI